MSFIKGAREFFGLDPVDEEHDDAYYDEPRYAPSRDYSRDYEPRERDSRPLAGESSYRSSHETYSSASSSSRLGASAGASHRGRGGASTSDYVPVIVAVEPRSYAEATEVGEPFRQGDAVTFELTNAERDVAKRIIDFAAGLCFASRGSMHNLSKDITSDRKVFAVVPEGADVSLDELQRAAGLVR
ncbi:cell division protein SepF [Corynebacterium tapiri]|uniref:Cell division protein SepF n=1 Tax=Corynebacterium tapiri TaxID=1448266 RepID=A0A5C4U673_9CORY|nr:cell division protein SepF [Corynebacterium tapiri]TNL99392.1 DUF552 domain-containing protein [Corynebacterium tapiri]